MVERQKRYIQLRNYRSRKLRRRQTPQEEKLWEKLKNRKLGVKFRRQHAIRGFITDFYSREAKIVIELDGRQHAEGEQQEYDQERTLYLESGGLLVIRYWNYQIDEDIESVVEDIQTHIAERHPQLP